ncbi:MAG TPA: glycosyltransferase family 2 protein, partial [Clostridia bacterium]|nr:glycosyltransferase family 2 protein [Clostridia bacterium]
MKNVTDLNLEKDNAGSFPIRQMKGATGTESGAGAPQMRAPDISVIAPLWNEKQNVRPLVDRILQAFQNEPRSIELILVDDVSTDGTWEEMLEVQRNETRLRPLRLARHCGQSAALWAGFTASRGAIIATLDGDLQNDPADLPRMMTMLNASDMVCGARARRMDTPVRRISSKVARWARRIVLGVDFRDTGCNLRVFKRSVIPTLFPFDGLHRFMPILAHGAGAVVTETSVTHHPRTAGKSKYGVWNS